MDETPNLALPYIVAAQAQKHITHNEALRALDAVVQMTVLDRDLAAPPVSPANGDRYIVAASPSGAWAGMADAVAAWQDGAWIFYPPREGWIAWVADEDKLCGWDGAAWVIAGGGGTQQDVPMIGINATADATNRLVVASDATLFNHDGAGHQHKINKAAAGDTASILYQTGFSGRAELGTTGDDDFHFKVSPDGSTWYEAITIDRSSGKAAFPLTPKREVLTANRTYYVRTDGSDSNTGLVNSSGGAFLTLQKAWNVVMTLDLSGFTVTISVAAGTYSAGISATISVVGGLVTVSGAGATTIISSGSNRCFSAESGASFKITNLKVEGTSGTLLYAADGGAITLGTGLTFGATSTYHMRADIGGSIRNDFGAALTVDGDAAYHMYALGGNVFVNGVSMTVSGSRAYTRWAMAETGGRINAFGYTFTGSATGQRYNSQSNAIINVFGGGASVFPGNSAGATATGGIYQ